MRPRVQHSSHRDFAVIDSADGDQEVSTTWPWTLCSRSQIPAALNKTKMATQQSTRIWENDSSAPAPNRTSQPQAATLPSIATLTNELPPGANGQSSPTYPNNRSSDQWATPPQSTRKLHRVQSHPSPASLECLHHMVFFLHPSSL